MAASGAIPESKIEVELKASMTLTTYWEAVLKLLDDLEKKYGPPDASGDEGYKIGMKAIRTIAGAGKNLETYDGANVFTAKISNLMSLDKVISAARKELKGEEHTPVITGEASLELAEGYLKLLQHFGNGNVKAQIDGLVQGGLRKAAVGKPKSGYDDARDSAEALEAAIKKYRTAGELKKAPQKSPEEQISEAKIAIQKKHAQAVTAGSVLKKEFEIFHDAIQALSLINKKTPELPLVGPAPQEEDHTTLHAATDAFLKSDKLKLIRREVKIYEGARTQEQLRAEFAESMRFLYDEHKPPQSSRDLYRKMLDRDARLIERYRAEIIAAYQGTPFEGTPEYKLAIADKTLHQELDLAGILLIPLALQKKCDTEIFNDYDNYAYKRKWVFEGAYRRAFAEALANEFALRVKKMNAQLAILDESHTEPDMVVIKEQEEILKKRETERKRKEEIELAAREAKHKEKAKPRETKQPVTDTKIESVEPENKGVNKEIKSIDAAVKKINQVLLKYRAINEMLLNKLAAKGTELKAPHISPESKIETLHQMLDRFPYSPPVKILRDEMSFYKGAKGAEKLRQEILSILRYLGSGDERMPLTAKEIYMFLKSYELISPAGQKKWDNRLRDATKFNLRSYAGGSEGFHQDVLAEILTAELHQGIEVVNEQMGIFKQWEEAKVNLLAAAYHADKNSEVLANAVEKHFLEFNNHNLDAVLQAQKLLDDLIDLNPKEAVLKKSSEASELKSQIKDATEEGKVNLMREFVYNVARDEVVRVMKMDNYADQNRALLAIAKVISYANDAIKSPAELDKVNKLKEAIREIAGNPSIGWKFVGALMIAAGTLTGDKSMVAKGWASFESGYKYAKQGAMQLGAAFGWVASHAEKEKTSNQVTSQTEKKRNPRH